MRKRKSTMPVIIDNQPQCGYHWWKSGDGAKSISESQKNKRNKMNLISQAEQAKKKPKTKPPKPKKIIRSKTRITALKSVRTINN